ncbi:hypothetical protein BT69DRAFT_709505 [Atractiella rhizophila]|nr:hypothetical protein BT69DRAFT_709505 [Atractiella rhizophila]
MATTFILLADPQINKAPEPERYETCGNLNVALNNFKQNNAVYPSIKGINCAGQPIAPIAATFIAGDLTQFGGNLNRGEQADLTKGPATYVGGEFLRRLRALYCPGAGKTGSDKQVEKLIDTGPIYFGLGNHDLEGAAGEGPPGWRFSNGAYSTPNNHFRYQMWNFINQMHGSPKAPFKIPALYKGGWDETGRHLQMDCPLEGSYEWQKYSMNYVVNLGPVDVYQLHVFGGDPRHGRNDGLEWLKRTLAIKGYSRPVIIVQHDLPSETQDQWVDEEATVHETNHLMEVLLPYNVIAFLVGHNHDQGPCPQEVPRIPPRLCFRSTFRTVQDYEASRD